MSRYTYAGNYRNATEGFYVCQTKDERFEIWIRSERESDGSCRPDRKHTFAPVFNDHSDAAKWIADLAQFFEDEIARMKRYEDWLNGY